MRASFVIIAVAAFTCLGFYDIAHGDVKIGAISLLLAVVNGLVLA